MRDGGAVRGRRRFRFARRVLVLAVVLPSMLLVGAGTGNAGILPVGASDCLSGEAGPTDIVGYATTWPTVVYLSCGTGTTGVLHIDRRHPVADDGSDDADFLRCFNRVMAYGENADNHNDNLVRELTLDDGRKGRVVWDPKLGEVVTMYTTGAAPGNDWKACAGGEGLLWVW